MTTPGSPARALTVAQVTVLGELRQADEHELEPWQIAPRVQLPIRQVVAALRDLRRLGLVTRRVTGRRFLYSWPHHHAPRKAVGL